MKKHSTMLLLLTLISLSYSALIEAKSLNLMLAESDTLKLGDKVPVLVGNELVFERIEGDTSSVWVFNRLTGSMRSLNIQSPIEIREIKGQAVIVSHLNEFNANVSVYTGTSNDAEILFTARKSWFAPTYGIYIYQSRDALYVHHDDHSRRATVGRYDGDQLIRYINRGLHPYGPLGPDQYHTTCEIGDDYYSQTFRWHQFGTSPGNGHYYSLLLKNQDEVIPLRRELIFDMKLEVVNGSCFISGYDSRVDETFLLYVYRPDEGMMEVDRSNTAAKLSRFHYKDGFVYAVSKGANAGVYKLHPDTLEVIKFQPIEYPAELNNYPTLIVAGERLISSLQETEVFDLDLNKVSLSTALPLINVSDEVAFEYWSDATVVANKNNKDEWVSNSEPKFSLITSDQKIFQFSSSPNFKMNDIRVDSYNEKILVTGIDHQSKKFGYYVLEDQPQINAAINGAWYDPDMANQGLALNKGIRHDGSEYVFVTAYLFENGKPLWLAGTGEITASVDIMTVHLYRFSGLNMLESGNQQADHEFVGNMTLSLSDCNTLDIEWVDTQQTHELSMIRADNVMYKNWCQN
ncbi:hypothetical protein [Marinicella rhabdoformis]|uniref:hypothetical protein n=1 Tax=Marinicella rhabdoformis TaxID=2580566 RepID=UPI0012AED9AB|nr:hypothetical protein [Marinicella rhabdoformis]